MCVPEPLPEIKAETAIRDDFASRKAGAYKKASSPRQKFVHFGPVTEMDQQTWKRLSIGKAGPRQDGEEAVGHSSRTQTCSVSPASAAASRLEDQTLNPQNGYRYSSPLRMCARSVQESLPLLKSLLKHIKETTRDDLVLTGSLLVSREVMLVASPGGKPVKLNDIHPF